MFKISRLLNLQKILELIQKRCIISVNNTSSMLNF